MVRLYNGSGDVDLIVDLEGYYTTTYSAGCLPTTPRRVLGTRLGTGVPKGQLRADSSVQVKVTGLPTSPTSVTLNLTATGLKAPTLDQRPPRRVRRGRRLVD